MNLEEDKLEDQEDMGRTNPGAGTSFESNPWPTIKRR
jgi:hypothetical protein